jgi:hypothetical protein
LGERVLDSILDFLKDETNRDILSFIGAGIAAAAVGLWAVYTHFAGRQPQVPDAVKDKAKECVALLKYIRDANARIIRRARRGGKWAPILATKVNYVCEMRAGARPQELALAPLLSDPHLKTVCDSKHYLGERLDEYRACIDSAFPRPWKHDDLQQLIRKSVVLPDLSAEQLQGAVNFALKKASAMGLR